MVTKGRTMRLNEVINAAKDQLQSILTLDVANVVAASKTDDGWNVKIELVERKAIPDTQDLLGTYDVILDEEGNIVSYERKMVRKRMDLVEETIE
jgi:hypothetical protein